MPPIILADAPSLCALRHTWRVFPENRPHSEGMTNLSRGHSRRQDSILRAALLLGLFLAWLVCAAPDPQVLQRELVARFGPARVSLLKDWLQLLTQTRAQASDETKLRRINDFVNRNIAFEADISVWQQSDYWATPIETIGQGRGDCEDFAILKYVSLRQVGVPASRLRLIYVKARLQTPVGPQVQAHMVLAYYATPNAEPLVLDNLNPAIVHAGKRNDLTPVFSFNSDGIYAGISGRDKAASGVGRLSRWADVLQRIAAEGLD